MFRTPCAVTARAALSICCAGVLTLSILPSTVNAAPLDDGLVPGVPISPYLVDSLNDPIDQSDVYRVYLLAGERIDMFISHNAGMDFDLHLYPPTATDFSAPTVATSNAGVLSEQIIYTAAAEGWYYLRVYADSGVGEYVLGAVRSWPSPVLPDSPERVWGSDRYTTAVEIAKMNYPGWVNLQHVILASGDDRAAADPLAAAGLTWTYGAPILLVSSEHVPPSVMNAIQGIANANGGSVNVHVVGGNVTIPDARLAEIVAQVPGASISRVTPNANRYELAGSIARRMAAERPTNHFLRVPGFRTALIANGADPDKFFDALALAPIAASCGHPILLVEQDRVPPETAQALADVNAAFRIVGGGPATVSDAVVTSLNAAPGNADRWWGSNRYETARVIANNARSQPYAGVHYLNAHNVGVAAKLPDALTGGAFIGSRSGPVLLTQGDQLVWPTYSFLRNNTPQIGECYTLGGPVSVTSSTHGEIAGALAP